MPRQDVPYGGAICRLRERIAEIFDKLGEKLHTINGVPGDGDGNVKIVSGSSAVVISNDPTQNEIAVSLDTSQLPAAAVSSVNGQTGAVALDAGDIPTVDGDVQSDIQDLANDISGNTAAINAEALARQGADASLQTNINAVSASLPSAAAAAVAADPTVAYVASEINNKVDKITSGSSLKAYTHTGATQGETSVVDGTTAATIPFRDANGYIKAASPATGVYDNNLANGTKIKNELDNYTPMVRTTGNQLISGIKIFDTRIELKPTADYNGMTLLIQGLQWTNTPPAAKKRQRLIQVSDQSGNYMIRLNIDVNTDGTVRLQYERRNIVNGQYVYDSGYLI